MVLRVNSPGGSVFGSELVRRELELTRAAGKPVVVSMGDLAASGGYWISTASDEIIADASTVTGSIGVIALLPNFAGTLDKLGVHSSPLATTWLRSAFDPRVPLDPRLADMIQRSVDHEYQSFIARVAQARKTTPEKIDPIAQGRVWSGAQALERGLIDRLGLYGDALRSAAARAKLGDDPRIVYIEREPSAFSRFVTLLNAEVARTFSASIDGKLYGIGLPAARAGAGDARARLAGRPHRAQEALRRRRPLPLHGAVLKAAAGRRRAAAVAQPGAARSGSPPARSVPGARRRRLGQDARHRPQDRAPARGRLRAGADRGDHLHQQGRGRDARAGGGAGRQARRGAAGDQHLPFARRAHAAQRWGERSA